ncbi:MAG: DNA methylase, partial [Spirochaetia bacterium]|nr:DNA methylase [Spirochaetota bacterium]MDW8113077.1 DNA methylase [Spirochaetia bacterium]
KYFQPVDIICVIRRNQASNTPFWQSKVIQHNFYLRGFKYLIIVKKSRDYKNTEDIKIKWGFYER